MTMTRESYYNYMKNNLPNNLSFSEFINDMPCPYGRWSDHVLSWTGNNKTNLLMIRYEDMYLDSVNKITEILEFLCLDINSFDIKKAIDKSNFSNMKMIESKYGRGKLKSGPDVFMRKGIIGDWKESYNSDDIKIFKKYEKDALFALDYI